MDEQRKVSLVAFFFGTEHVILRNDAVDKLRPSPLKGTYFYFFVGYGTHVQDKESGEEEKRWKGRRLLYKCE